jgi:hypothetical protein
LFSLLGWGRAYSHARVDARSNRQALRAVELKGLKNGEFLDEFRVIDSDGDNETALTEFGLVDDNTAFAVTRNGGLIWSQRQRDDDEIWTTRVCPK